MFEASETTQGNFSRSGLFTTSGQIAPRQKADENKEGVRAGRPREKSIYISRIMSRAQLAGWGCSARFCLISLTLSTRSSACLSREARSSADSTMSALRR
jgi:hypothetical protein